eukprot:gene7513-8944_t
MTTPSQCSEVPVVDAMDLSPAEFKERFMLANRPVLLKGLTTRWQAIRDWVTDQGSPDLPFLRQRFGQSVVPVTDCKRTNRKLEMTLNEYLTWWEAHHTNTPADESLPATDTPALLYLKDWNFTQEFPEYEAYTTPEHFSPDWLNAYWDRPGAGETEGEDDEQCSGNHRFVYMGPAGTWTPLHADGADGRFPVDVYEAMAEPSRFPQLSKASPVEVSQGPGDVIFVPSGWWHQVHNLEPTISVNHNWLNGGNISWAWEHLTQEMHGVKSGLFDEDDRDDDELCQQLLHRKAGAATLFAWDECSEYTLQLVKHRSLNGVLVLIVVCSGMDQPHFAKFVAYSAVLDIEQNSTLGTGNAPAAGSTEQGQPHTLDQTGAEVQKEMMKRVSRVVSLLIGQGTGSAALLQQCLKRLEDAGADNVEISPAQEK